MNKNTITLKDCGYNAETKSLRISSEFFGMPSKFSVYSHHSGRTVEFIRIYMDDPMFDPDQWDGEQQIYRPVQKTKNVEYCVIYNQW